MKKKKKENPRALCSVEKRLERLLSVWARGAGTTPWTPFRGEVLLLLGTPASCIRQGGETLCRGTEKSGLKYGICIGEGFMCRHGKHIPEDSLRSRR